MIVNHFKMRGDVISYNLAGMGCSAGVIAIGLAQRLLRTEPGKYALVVSTENITQGDRCCSVRFPDAPEARQQTSLIRAAHLIMRTMVVGTAK